MRFFLSPVGFLGAVLRFGMATALAVALVLPHFSTPASAPGFSKVMDHLSAGHGDMNQMPTHHGNANGSLCATICAGTDQVSGPDMAQQSFSIGPAFWTVTSAPYWALYSPDPALRPPDFAFIA